MDRKTEKKSYELPTCPICLNELTSDLMTTVCGHVFHSQCILKCFETNSVCPNCRKRQNLGSLVNLNFHITTLSEINLQLQEYYDNLSNDERDKFTLIMSKNEDLMRINERLKKDSSEWKSKSETSVKDMELAKKSALQAEGKIKKLKEKKKYYKI